MILTISIYREVCVLSSGTAANHRRQRCGSPANHSITTTHDLHNNPFRLRSKCQNTTAQVVRSIQNGATALLSCTIILRNRITAVYTIHALECASAIGPLYTRSGRLTANASNEKPASCIVHPIGSQLLPSPWQAYSNMTAAASKHLICWLNDVMVSLAACFSAIFD